MMFGSGTRYEIGHLIGSGGMAEVYEGVLFGAEGFVRSVAIKRMRLELSRDPAFTRLFIREGHLASLLTHPNIVRVHDVSRDQDGRLVLVMDLVRGVDLARFLAAGAVSPSIASHIAVSVLRGLAHAHTLEHEGRYLGIVHCDLSPHNVMLSFRGAAKIVDFGVARALAHSQFYSWLPGQRQAGHTLLGKLSYTSPEQVHGAEIDGRADLFSLGIIFYEMLTGRRLFAGPDRPAILAKILRKKIAPVRLYRPEVAPGVEAVCMRLLARDRARRFPSAERALAALLPFADQPGPALAGRRDLARLLRLRFADLAPSEPDDIERLGGELALDGAVPFLSSDAVPLLPSQVMVSGRASFVDAMNEATRTIPDRRDFVEPPPADKKKLLTWVLVVAAVIAALGLVAALPGPGHHEQAPGLAPALAEPALDAGAASAPARP